jgi:hypothetical protein
MPRFPKLDPRFLFPTLLLLGSALAAGFPGGVHARSGRGEAPALRGTAQPDGDAKNDDKPGEKKNETDSEDLFGFTVGSDIGDVGETELSLDTQLRAARRGGRYRVWSPSLEAEYVPFENFSFAGSVAFDSFQIRGVQGLDDRTTGGVSAVGAEFKYRFLKRDESGVGLTLSVAPRFGFFNQDSGERGIHTGLKARLSADTELVPDSVFAALNLSYEPERFRPKYAVGPDGDPTQTERESTFGVSGALSFRLNETLFAGGELRYLRKYDGLAARSFQGEAVYLGPTLYWQVAEKVALSAAWNAQVTGHAKGQPGALDLDNFERHQARLKLKVSF